MAMFTKRRPLGEAGTAKSGGFGRTLGIILGVALIAILVMSCFTRVPTGNTGIVTTFGKVENYTLGRHAFQAAMAEDSQDGQPRPEAEH